MPSIKYFIHGGVTHTLNWGVDRCHTLKTSSNWNNIIVDLEVKKSHGGSQFPKQSTVLSKTISRVQSPPSKRPQRIISQHCRRYADESDRVIDNANED